MSGYCGTCGYQADRRSRVCDACDARFHDGCFDEHDCIRLSITTTTKE